MDTPGQAYGIFGILGGGKYATMGQTLPVQALKMAAVVSEHGSAKQVCASQNIRIELTLMSVLLRGQHIISKAAQFVDSSQGKILIGVELHPGSLHNSIFTFLVLPDRAINFFSIGC
jgi:hypothetical protein